LQTVQSAYKNVENKIGFLLDHKDTNGNLGKEVQRLSLELKSFIKRIEVFKIRQTEERTFRR
jgi:hypothetical protein